MIEIVQKHSESGLLLPINPVLGPVVRRIWVTPEIHKMVYGPHKDSEEAKAWKETQARIEHIVSGKQFAVGNKKDCFMAPMTKPPRWDVWDVRSKKRIMGSFVKLDFFIGILWADRKDLETPEKWESLINRTRKKWEELFPQSKALTKEGDYESYLSNITVIGRHT